MAACAQIGRFYDLPTSVAASMSDSKIPDAQAGFEKGITAVTAGLAGANRILESAGMLGSLLGCSLEALVIDKPAGMVVHPAPGAERGTLVNALLHHCGASLSGIGGVRRPGIVHRLDKDTSGLIVAAKTDALSVTGTVVRIPQATGALAFTWPFLQVPSKGGEAKGSFTIITFRSASPWT